MKYSIKGKILACFTFVMLLILIGQVVFGELFANSYYIHRKAVQIEQSFYQLKAVYETNPHQMEQVIGELQEKYGISINLLEPHQINRGLMGVGKRSRAFREIWDVEEELSFSNEPKALVKHNKNLKGCGVLRLLGKLEQTGNTKYVLIFMPLETISNSVQILNKANIIITLGAILIGMIVCSIILQGIVRPIKRIEGISKELAQLNFSEEANEEVSTKEIANLAKSINSMSQQLKEAINQLQKTNKGLQEDIDSNKKLEKMRREFVANVSHEMKTPLSLLQIYCENLKEDIEGIDKDYYYNTIIEEAERLNKLVKSMLDISSIENGLAQMNRKPIDFSFLCKHVIDKMKPLLKDYKLACEIQEQITLLGDEQYLEQAIKNYIMNAIVHTAIGDIIKIGLYSAQNEVVFEVFNEGKWIDEKDLPYIWQSFYKSDRSRTRVDGVHAGQGLYIVKTIITKHQGKYSVANEEGGVKFKFTLPIKTIEEIS